jgi:sugar lactone lactonase YvrE
MKLQHSIRSGLSRLSAAVFAVSVLLGVVGEAHAANFTIKGSVLSPLPAAPGYPEGILVDHGRVFVAGPARFGTAGTGPSTISMFQDVTGIPLGTITIQGEDLTQEHALSCIAVDAKGRVYALSTQLGVLRLRRSGASWVQEVYADPLPDLPPCGGAPDGSCSPTPTDEPPLVNDIAFDEDGHAYVTDSTQATIWRIAPGGGVPEPWFQNAALGGFPFVPSLVVGVNGVRISPDGASVYVSVTFSVDNPSVGRIFALPRIAAPAAKDLALVHEYPSFEGPDGFAFGAGGLLYVALAGSNEISLLYPGFGEIARLSGPKNSSVPFDAPANIAFDGLGSILIANHALMSGDATHFAVLRAFVGDPGMALWKPVLP